MQPISEIDDFDTDGLFFYVEGNSADVIVTPNETKDYKSTNEYKIYKYIIRSVTNSVNNLVKKIKIFQQRQH